MKKQLSLISFHLVFGMVSLFSLLTSCGQSAKRPSEQSRAYLKEVAEVAQVDQSCIDDSLLLSAISFFDQHEMYPELQQSLLLRADILHARNKNDDAVASLLEAAALGEALGDSLYVKQVFSRLMSVNDSVVTAETLQQALRAQRTFLSRHSFNEPINSSKIGFSLSAAVTLIMFGFMLFYKVRLDHQIQIEKLKRLQEQRVHRTETEIAGLRQLREDAVVKRFRESFTHSYTVTQNDWSDLRLRFSTLYPSFETRLRDVHSLSDVEWQVCMLLKLGFSPSDISVLTSRSQATVSTIRSRLYSKFFLQKGGASDWDRFIDSL